MNRSSEWKEDGIQRFFARWSKKVLENDYLCYDITSLSSYSEMFEKPTGHEAF
jgi:hypothetical protein